ncbi:ubiquitin carboxyl-terminal hydrolase 30 isoform X2 [Ambystoma mexicanum]|uniref:ubiquitin carboxyl-terminal hydrolase 30 isoform X2 n=1 Tax=Ambystoma mexicanum TaxID=8296 RepID=UPI0037E8E6EA
MQNWGMIGGIAAAFAAGLYVLWGPITDRKKRKKALSNQDAADDELLDASCLLEVLRMYRWQISSFEEQDAHELFHVLTSSLEDERDRRPRVTHLFDIHSLEAHQEVPEKQISCRSQGLLHPMPSHWKFQHPFHGRLTNNMLCKRCEQQSPVRYDTFDSLSLSIPAATWGQPLTLDHCLQHFISSESVKDVVCENCTNVCKIQADDTINDQSIEHQKTTFVKQLKLGKLPQCLCIHLQRMSWSNEGTPLKRHDHVQFNEFLMLDFYKYHLPGKRLAQHHLKPREHAEASNDIKAGTTKPQELTHPNTSKTLFTNGAFSPSLFSLPLTPTTLKVIPDYSSSMYLYRLVAVVVHHGDMHSGHFVTYRRSPTSLKSSAPYSNQWLWISDDTVRKASLQEVLSSNAYLLFYERVHTKVWRSGQDVKAEE